MFKDIPGYEGLYQIDENGNVLSLKYNKIKVTRMPDENYLYPYIILYKDSKQKKYGIHQLVAKTFIPNPDNLPVVMHKDNNKMNPHVSNLMWGTVQDNVDQAVKDGLNISRPRDYYQLCDSNNIALVTCFGYRDVINKVGYGTKSMFRYALNNDSQFKYGPYKGCTLRKMVRGVTYDE